MGALSPSGSRRIKVVHVTTLHPTFDIRIFQKECRTLAEAGYDVTLIAPAEHNEVVDGVAILAIPRNNNRLHRMTIGGWRAYRLAKSLRAQIYHFHDPELLPWMALLRRRAHVIYDVHEDLAKSISTKGWVPRALRPAVAALSRWTERNDSKHMHLVLAEESYARDYNWAPSTTVLNLPRVEELLRINEPQYSTPTAVYFGAVNSSRGSETVIEAAAELGRQGLTLRVEYIGHGSPAHMKLLKERAAASLVDLATFGYLPPVQGWLEAAKCHVGLALLHPLPNYVESYPTKIFEYMALGLPVIASDFELYRSVLQDNECGICVNPLDPHAIAQALQWMVGHPDEAQQMGQRGRVAVIEKYNWNTEATTLLKLYGELSNGR